MSDVIWRYAPRDSAHEGAYIVGIPMRDLTEEDLDEYNIDEEDLERSPLYERVRDPIVPMTGVAPAAHKED